ncbi:MAG: hypothetical protein HY958_04400 [Bacteroidia bacterium]|nr:hypothetical protein [Bacteroidia bacterium]
MNVPAYILTVLLISSQPFFSKIFRDDYTNAVNFIKQNKTLIEKTCSQYDNENAVVLSVVFPELIRYSYFKDFFETSALEVVYTKYGSGYVDFSIGRLQMKPSFIETLENTVLKDDSLHQRYKIITEFKSDKPELIRQTRVERLKTLKWQLIYANCFIAIMDEKFKDVEWPDIKEKIRIYATAYNHGFNHSLEKIKKWQSDKTFPYGGTNPENQYAYGDVAVDFYLNGYSGIMQKKTVGENTVLTNK